MERRLTAGAPKREDTTTERLMREFEQRIVASPPGVCPVDMQLSFLKDSELRLFYSFIMDISLIYLLKSLNNG